MQTSELIPPSSTSSTASGATGNCYLATAPNPITTICTAVDVYVHELGFLPDGDDV